jgi:hypothetical protein
VPTGSPIIAQPTKENRAYTTRTSGALPIPGKSSRNRAVSPARDRKRQKKPPRKTYTGVLIESAMEVLLLVRRAQAAIVSNARTLVVELSETASAVSKPVDAVENLWHSDPLALHYKVQRLEAL